MYRFKSIHFSDTVEKVTPLSKLNIDPHQKNHFPAVALKKIVPEQIKSPLAD